MTGKLILILLLLLIIPSQGQDAAIHYHLAKIAETGSIIVDSLVSTSIYSCFAHCKSTSTCHAVSYDPVTEGCVLRSRLLTSAVRDLDVWLYKG